MMPKLLISSEPRTSVAPLGVVLAPFLLGRQPALRELLGLLPVHDVNAATMAAIRDHPFDDADVVAGLLLADPFLRIRDVTNALRAAAVRRIANYPTVQLIDGETARAFDSAGAGVAREIEMLASFQEHGFSTVAFATTLPTAQAMVRNGAGVLVLHPGLAFSDWRERANAALGVARMIPALRAISNIPVLVHNPHGFGPELDQAIALADGTARIDG